MFPTRAFADHAGFLRSDVVEVENDTLGLIAPFGVARQLAQNSRGVFWKDVVGEHLAASCRGLRRFRSIHDASEHGFLAAFCPGRGRRSERGGGSPRYRRARRQW